MKETIKYLRDKNNFSQTYLASYLGVSRQMYIKYEAGEVEPPVHVIRMMSKLYSVSYDDLIDNKFSEQNINSYSIYEKSYKVASPLSSYLVSENSELSKIISQLSKLPEKLLPSVSAFVLLLQQENKKPEKNHVNQKSKKDFFELAGKIKLNKDEVTAFREESLI